MLSKSLIIQDGLEVPEIADMENRLAMAKYETMTAKHYKEVVDWKYKDTTAAALAGLCSKLKDDMELFSTSSESELGQEWAQPTTKNSCTTSGADRAGTLTFAFHF